MPLNDTFTGIIEKLTQKIEELKAQIGAVDTKSTMAYNQSVSLADAIAKMKEQLAAQQAQVNELETQVNDLDANTSRTTTTPPTADGEGLPGFVILDTKPETEYQNYVYIYPRD